jgi:hypothetical protein
VANDSTPSFLYLNQRNGTFKEVAFPMGVAVSEDGAEQGGMGLAVGDLDNDGRLDVVINDLDGSPQVLRNELAESGNWLLVKLEGKGKNTDAIGAVVKVKAGKLSLIRLVQSGTSYLSQEDMRRSFGLGPEKQADSVEVQWPDGTTTKIEKVRANQIVEIRQR